MTISNLFNKSEKIPYFDVTRTLYKEIRDVLKNEDKEATTAEKVQAVALAIFSPLIVALDLLIATPLVFLHNLYCAYHAYQATPAPGDSAERTGNVARRYVPSHHASEPIPGAPLVPLFNPDDEPLQYLPRSGEPSDHDLLPDDQLSLGEVNGSHTIS